MNAPRVSVIMPVFNGGDYLGAAIESICGQSYTDFEFLIVDDGSVDGSLEIASSYAKRDRRIHLLSRENRGIAFSLNEGVRMARGEYIARMDADDYSFHTRLEKQVNFLDSHPGIGIVGTGVRVLRKGRSYAWRLPADDDGCRARLLFSVAVAHPTVMMRRSLFTHHGLHYREELPSAEDYDLWVQAMDVTKFANLNEVLLDYREHPSSESKVAESRKSGDRFQVIGEIFCRVLDKVNWQLSEQEKYLHFCLGLNERARRAGIGVDNYVRHLVELNARAGSLVVNKSALNRLILGKYVALVYCLVLEDRPIKNWHKLLSPSVWTNGLRVLRSCVRN